MGTNSGATGLVPVAAGAVGVSVGTGQFGRRRIRPRPFAPMRNSESTSLRVRSIRIVPFLFCPPGLRADGSDAIHLGNSNAYARVESVRRRKCFVRCHLLARGQHLPDGLLSEPSPSDVAPSSPVRSSVAESRLHNGRTRIAGLAARLHSGVAVSLREKPSCPEKRSENLLAPTLPAIRKLVSAKIRMPDYTEDVVQQTLMHAFAHREQLRVHSKFKSWISSIAMNEIRGLARRTRICVPFEAIAAYRIVSTVRPVPLRYSRTENGPIGCYAGLAQLNPRDRDAIHLMDLAEVKLTDAANALSVSRAALKSTHFRARQRLSRAVRANRKGSRLELVAFDEDPSLTVANP